MRNGPEDRQAGPTPRYETVLQISDDDHDNLMACLRVGQVKSGQVGRWQLYRLLFDSLEYLPQAKLKCLKD